MIAAGSGLDGMLLRWQSASNSDDFFGGSMESVRVLSNSQASSAASNADGLPASGSRGNIYIELGQGVWRLSGGLLTKDRVAGGVFRVYAADSGNDTLLGTSSMAADVDLAIDGVPTGKSHMHLAPTPPISLELATAIYFTVGDSKSIDNASSHWVAIEFLSSDPN